MKAHEFLKKAKDALASNAALRDSPEGERSALKAAQILTAWTGCEWTEENVWRCLLAVKLSRESQGNFHFDDYVDLAGYASLLGECRHRNTTIGENPKMTHKHDWAADQAAFMTAGNQTTSGWNLAQASRYAEHITEEAREFGEAFSDESMVDAVDGALDVIVVAIGFLYSLGLDPHELWGAVHAANMRKVVDGKVYRRADGQIGKPPGWYGPEDELSDAINRVRPTKNCSVLGE